MPQSTPIHVLIADGLEHRLEDDFALERTRWAPLGIDVTLAAAKSEDDLIQLGHDADILVYLGLYTPFTARVIAALPRCRTIARYGIGMDSVDLDAATAHGVVVANAAEYCVPEVADHAAALVLSLARRIVFLDRFVQDGRWAGSVEQMAPVPRLATQTLGLVGFGRIARHAVRNLAPFFGEILAFDPYIEQAAADPYRVQMVGLDELLARSDYISVHAPLLPSTRGLIGAAQLAQMKRTAYLVNTSRGPVVDEAALTAALESRQIAGAALDVFESEPLAGDSPLRGLDNVILTPHFAAYSDQAIDDLRDSVIRTVSAVAEGYWPPYVMNPSVKPRFPLRKR